MQHPFQCIASIHPSHATNSSGSGYLLAACGTKLTCTCLETGKITSEWNAVDAESTTSPTTATAETSKDPEGNERPAKKQKLSSHQTPSQQKKKKTNIILLAISPDNAHILMVTDDKCLHVFAADQTGTLTELSARTMPKRPCAVHILPDNATILCGDKFGDVYSLPLHPEQNPSILDHASSAAAQVHAQRKPFQPSATTQTVHTTRNLQSLRAQQTQKNLTPKTKLPPSFAHKLLISHVSMLTSLVSATRQGRQYILTADRDEHIRVSRGARGQEGVIETYCLGHKEFVSKIAVLPAAAAAAGKEGEDGDGALLVSGGGDAWVGIWEWERGELRGRRRLPGYGSSAEEDEGESVPLPAVSGIWMLPLPRTAEEGGGGETVVLVALERSNWLYWFPASHALDPDDGGGWGRQEFDAPVLDVAYIRTAGVVIISFDTRHASQQKRLRAFRLQGEGKEVSGMSFAPAEAVNGCLQAVNAVGKVEEDGGEEKALDALLYSVEQLRKRGYGEEEAGDGGAEEEG